MSLKIKGIIYLGIKTEKFRELNHLFGGILDLPKEEDEPGFTTYKLPSGAKIELYGPNDPHKANHDFYKTGPVAGFEVDDIVSARKAMEEKGIEFIGPIQGKRLGGSRWSHFRGPDGNIYEIKQVKTKSYQTSTRRP